MCITLHSTQQCTISLFPHPHQHSSLIILMRTISASVRWYIVIVICISIMGQEPWGFKFVSPGLFIHLCCRTAWRYLIRIPKLTCVKQNHNSPPHSSSFQETESGLAFIWLFFCLFIYFTNSTNIQQFSNSSYFSPDNMDITWIIASWLFYLLYRWLSFHFLSISIASGVFQVFISF